MKRKIVILAMLLATTFFLLPASGDSVSAQGKQNRGNRSDRGDSRRKISLWDRTNHGKKKNNHGYKNYGQYRRTQVGNRRFRNTSTRTWYLRNGIRVYRRRMNN